LVDYTRFEESQQVLEIVSMHLVNHKQQQQRQTSKRPRDCSTKNGCVGLGWIVHGDGEGVEKAKEGMMQGPEGRDERRPYSVCLQGR
jgi:hypothetical protein